MENPCADHISTQSNFRTEAHCTRNWLKVKRFWAKTLNINHKGHQEHEEKQLNHGDTADTAKNY